MPLVWAHAEFMKLVAGLRLGRPVDRPEPVWLRYGGLKPEAPRAHWTRRMPVGWVREGQILRVVLESRSLIHWGVDDWQDARDVETGPGFLGLHVVDLPTDQLEVGRRIIFSILEQETGHWIEHDQAIVIAPRINCNVRGNT